MLLNFVPSVGTEAGPADWETLALLPQPGGSRDEARTPMAFRIDRRDSSRYDAASVRLNFPTDKVGCNAKRYDKQHKVHILTHWL